MYYVVVCPDKYCRGVTILSDKNESVKCRTCGDSHKFDKYKISFQTENHNEAIEARTRLLTKMSDSGPTMEDIIESGGLEEPEYKPKNEKDTRKPVEIIQDIIVELENPTKENIVNKSTSEGLSEKKAEKLVDRFLQKGRAIENNGEIELI